MKDNLNPTKERLKEIAAKGRQLLLKATEEQFVMFKEII